MNKDWRNNRRPTCTTYNETSELQRISRKERVDWSSESE